MNLMQLFLLVKPVAAQTAAEAKETSDSLARAAAITLLSVSLLAWIIAWRFYRIENRGKIYFFIHAGVALVYLPFLVRFFFVAMANNFNTGKEHYLLMFFIHSAIMVFASLAFNSRKKPYETY